jgi:Flp pilus assembly protein TadG
MKLRAKRRGSAMLEFVLTGVPLIFVWLSIVQMSLGMWQYHTLQYAVKAAGAYASVHGSNCLLGTNSCEAHLSDTALVLANTAFAIPRKSITVTFTAWKTAADAKNHANPSKVSCRLDNCISQTAYQTMQWPPNMYNNANNAEIAIRAEFLWKTSLAMITPAGSTSGAGAYWLPGYTHQTVLF